MNERTLSLRSVPALERALFISFFLTLVALNNNVQFLRLDERRVRAPARASLFCFRRRDLADFHLAVNVIVAIIIFAQLSWEHRRGYYRSDLAEKLSVIVPILSSVTSPLSLSLPRLYKTLLHFQGSMFLFFIFSLNNDD